MLQRASWLMWPLGPAPTISQSMARVLEGTEVLLAEGPALLGNEDDWELTCGFGLSRMSPFVPLTAKKEELCVEVDGFEPRLVTLSAEAEGWKDEMYAEFAGGVGLAPFGNGVGLDPEYPGDLVH